MTASLTSSRTAQVGKTDALSLGAPAWVRRTRQLFPYAVGLLSFTAYATLMVLKFYQRHGSWDTAVFTQAVKGYANLSAPTVDVETPGMNQLGEHFSPILAALAPLYRAFPSSLTLDLAQVGLISLSAFLVCRTSIQLLGALPGGFIGAAYAISFGLQSAVIVGIHENCFSAPLIAMVGDRYLRGRYREAVYWSLPLLLVKEDFGLVIGALGVCLFLKGSRHLGLIVAAGAVLYLAVVVGFVIPELNPRGQYDFLSVATDGGRSGGIGHLLLNAPRELLTPAMKLQTLALTLFVVCGIAVRSPFAVLALPLILERFMSPVDRYWTPFWHYSLPIMTVLFVALIEVVRDWRSSPGRARQVVATVAPAVALVVSVCLLPFFALNLLAPGSEYWAKDPQTDVVKRVVAMVPDGSTVQADTTLTNWFVPDHRVFWITPPNSLVPQESPTSVDYMVVNQRDWEGLQLDGVQFARGLHPETTYDVIYDEAGITLLKRGV